MAKSDEDCAISKFSEIAYAPNSQNIEMGVKVPDIALIRLENPICGLIPAKMQSLAPEKGRHLKAAGFGLGSEAYRYPNRMDLEVVGNDSAVVPLLYNDLDKNSKQIAELYKSISSDLQRQAGHIVALIPVTPGQSLCNGDSGGPVYEERNGEVYLYGIVSNAEPHPLKGSRQCQNGYLQLATPLTIEIPWINETLRRWKK